MDTTIKVGRPDRSKLNINDEYEVRHWTKRFGVTKAELQEAVDKVGNSVAAVKKQLGMLS